MKDFVKIHKNMLLCRVLGRACRYDVPDDMFVFTNLQSLKDYEKEWDNEDFDKIISTKNKASCFSPRTYSGTDRNYDDNKVSSDVEPIIKKFKDQKELQIYFNEKLKGLFTRKTTGPKLRTPNTEGYYESYMGRKGGLRFVVVMKYLKFVNGVK